ncbi:MAG: hypothetical protein KAU16_03540 [Methanophagales archaeon]|nr:hypothetical protein [Methanophagales archaeon]
MEYLGEREKREIKMGNFSLIEASIVVLAKNHNPSIVSKDWLTQNKIIEEEILNFTHLPVVSIIETNNFNLFVDPNKLQLTIKKISSENLKALPQIISEYLGKLPETPYTAIGFNYSYRLETEARKIKEVLLIDETRLIEIFSEDYTFGGIITFAFGDLTVKLIIKPINHKEIGGDFNFHFASNKKDEIIKKLFEHPDTKRKADEILGGLFNAD